MSTPPSSSIDLLTNTLLRLTCTGIASLPNVALVLYVPADGLSLVCFERIAPMYFLLPPVRTMKLSASREVLNLRARARTTVSQAHAVPTPG
jgi:hypothetical protein